MGLCVAVQDCRVAAQALCAAALACCVAAQDVRVVAQVAA